MELFRLPLYPISRVSMILYWLIPDVYLQILNLQFMNQDKISNS